ncbi:MAG: hypothetical protein IPK19_13340 [Chloroflexi bacterium]|nr:hypothetical protein [Chloroflexota bacterium]
MIRDIIGGRRHRAVRRNKQQAQEAVASETERCGMPYVNLPGSAAR